MVFDSNLQFRNTTASATTTETSSAVEIGGTPIDGLALVVDIPKQSAGDTLQVFLQHSSDNSTYTTLLTTELMASVTQASVVPYKITRRFFTSLKYVRTIMAITGTSPDYGAVKIRIGDRDTWNNAAVGNETVTP